MHGIILGYMCVKYCAALTLFKAMITIEGLSAAVTAAVSVGLLYGYGLLGCVVGFLAGQLSQAAPIALAGGGLCGMLPNAFH